MKIANSRKDENYLTIYGWMTNRLKLSGNELLVYGLIYSFARSEKADFHGSAGYIASALNMSRRTVVSTLKSLTNKGLIQKRAAGRYCNYSVSPVQNLHTSCVEIAHVSVQNLLEPAQNLHQASANSSHHIKDIGQSYFKADIKNDSNSGGNVEKNQPTTAVKLYEHFLRIWKKNSDVFNFTAKIKNKNDWDDFWAVCDYSETDIDTRMEHYISGVKSGVIERRFIPASPDGFVINGWLQKSVEPFKKQGQKHRIANDNTTDDDVSKYFTEIDNEPAAAQSDEEIDF
jgi:predicted transcriptional regulator